MQTLSLPPLIEAPNDWETALFLSEKEGREGALPLPRVSTATVLVCAHRASHQAYDERSFGARSVGRRARIS